MSTHLMMTIGFIMIVIVTQLVLLETKSIKIELMVSMMRLLEMMVGLVKKETITSMVIARLILWMLMEMFLIQMDIH